MRVKKKDKLEDIGLYDADAQAFFDAFDLHEFVDEDTGEVITIESQKDSISELVKDLRKTGVWAETERIFYLEPSPRSIEDNNNQNLQGQSNGCFKVNWRGNG